MGKRRTDNLRSPSESRQNSERRYGKYVSDEMKKPSKVEPVWLQDSYEIVKEVANAKTT